MRKTIALVATTALVVGAFLAAPAEAAKKKKGLKCGSFTPAVEGAAEAPLTKITPAATEEAPVEIKLEHGMAGPSNPLGGDLFNEWQYANIQIFGPSSGLYIREEFSDHHDVDLYLYDGAGEEVASSGGFNTAPIPGVTDAGGNAGSNYESISGYGASTCAGYTIGSNAYLTYGTEATLKIWLGEVVAPE